MVRLKAETGARVSSRPRYGYMKDPADPKRHMVPDPETAPVVRYIFDLCVSGKGPAQIAKQLKKDRIPTPGYSYYQKHGWKLTGVDITQPYNWSTNTVAGILEDETYLGHTINLKSTTCPSRTRSALSVRSLSSSASKIHMKHLSHNRPGRSYRISESTNGVEPTWPSRISSLD
mgnify:CR=1 FL=1